MKWIHHKTAAMAALLCVTAAFGARDAAAQAPTLTATANGPVASVQWTSVPGATGYDVTVTGAFSGVVSLPASPTAFQVTPPSGTYNIQVRATAGSAIGPASNLVTITIGGTSSPGPCAPPAAPTLTVSTNGMVVTASWNAVPGVAGYRTEFSRVPGGTELVSTLGPGQTSLQGVSPFPGTFYARVVTGNACGTASSPEVTFTVGSSTPTPPGDGSGGGGTRTPNPIPGQPGLFFHDGEALLPIPSYGAAVVNALGAAFPGEAALARPSECAGGNNRFLFRVVQELRKRDTRWGLNYKRGNFPTLSEDILTYNGTSRTDNGESHVYVIDIVGGDCGRGVPTFSDKSVVGTWDQKGQPYCGTTYCARWNLDAYLAAGNPLFPQ